MAPRRINRLHLGRTDVPCQDVIFITSCAFSDVYAAKLLLWSCIQLFTYPKGAQVLHSLNLLILKYNIRKNKMAPHVLNIG